MLQNAERTKNFQDTRVVLHKSPLKGTSCHKQPRSNVLTSTLSTQDVRGYKLPLSCMSRYDNSESCSPAQNMNNITEHSGRGKPTHTIMVLLLHGVSTNFTSNLTPKTQKTKQRHDFVRTWTVVVYCTVHRRLGRSKSIR